MTVHNMDCREGLAMFPDNTFDSIVTDPPYELGFMGKSWDSTGIAYDVAMWREALRVLKPGGHLLAFSGSRTYHRMTCAIEDAGFDIRDQIMWVYGSGFPKSRNLDGEWKGWGTALKPAHEPICVARKPLIGTVAQNVLAHRTGAINIDGCRVPAEKSTGWGGCGSSLYEGGLSREGGEARLQTSGRWPANLIHDGNVPFPDAKGQQGDLKETGRAHPSSGRFGDMSPPAAHAARVELDTSAARFFYCAKTSKSDRGDGNIHPTVKPTDLMRYLCRLVTPPNGVILDLFAGSGSTYKAARLEGFGFVGFELSAEYAAIANRRGVLD